MFRISSLILVILLVSVILISCAPVLIQKEPEAELKKYFDSLNSKNYKIAYSILHPAFREKLPYDNFVQNAQNSEKQLGPITSVSFDKVSVFGKKNTDYVYDVTVSTPRKIIKYKIEMLKEKDRWFLNGIKAISSK
jgi:hypothetical protein